MRRPVFIHAPSGKTALSERVNLSLSRHGALRVLRRAGPLFFLVNLLTAARFVVRGDSMRPNLTSGDYLLVSRLEYLTSPPARGDVVVLRDPVQPKVHHVKRVIGLPGEEVDIRSGIVYIQGQRLQEPYLAKPDPQPGRYNGLWDIDSDRYFVLGDNRANSRDSRLIGPIERDLIIGKTWLRYWPPGRWGRISNNGALNFDSQCPCPKSRSSL